jgi:hypothetical protein
MNRVGEYVNCDADLYELEKCGELNSEKNNKLSVPIKAKTVGEIGGQTRTEAQLKKLLFIPESVYHQVNQPQWHTYHGNRGIGSEVVFSQRMDIVHKWPPKHITFEHQENRVISEKKIPFYSDQKYTTSEDQIRNADEIRNNTVNDFNSSLESIQLTATGSKHYPLNISKQIENLNIRVGSAFSQPRGWRVTYNQDDTSWGLQEKRKYQLNLAQCMNSKWYQLYVNWDVCTKSNSKKNISRRESPILNMVKDDRVKNELASKQKYGSKFISYFKKTLCNESQEKETSTVDPQRHQEGIFRNESLLQKAVQIKPNSTITRGVPSLKTRHKWRYNSDR